MLPRPSKPYVAITVSQPDNSSIFILIEFLGGGGEFSAQTEFLHGTRYAH